MIDNKTINIGTPYRCQICGELTYLLDEGTTKTAFCNKCKTTTKHIRRV